MIDTKFLIHLKDLKFPENSVCISRGQQILEDAPFCLNELSNQERKFIVDTCNQFRLRNTDKILLTMSTFTGDNVQYAWPCNV